MRRTSNGPSGPIGEVHTTARARPRSPGEDAPAGGRRRILVVDANVDAADMLAECVELLGATARAVYTARGALDVARSFAPDVVLLDLRLPDGTGAPLSHALRSECDARVIAVTGYRADDVAEEIAAGRFDACLTKPCSLDTLRRAIEGRLGP